MERINSKDAHGRTLHGIKDGKRVFRKAHYSGSDNVPRTPITTKWLNDVQLEILSVIEDSSIVPKSGKAQMVESIKKIVNNKAQETDASLTRIIEQRTEGVRQELHDEKKSLNASIKQTNAEIKEIKSLYKKLEGTKKEVKSLQHELGSLNKVTLFENKQPFSVGKNCDGGPLNLINVVTKTRVIDNFLYADVRFSFDDCYRSEKGPTIGSATIPLTSADKVVHDLYIPRRLEKITINLTQLGLLSPKKEESGYFVEYGGFLETSFTRPFTIKEGALTLEPIYPPASGEAHYRDTPVFTGKLCYELK